jgi:putative hydrolase of the HAD superfamily
MATAAVTVAWGPSATTRRRGSAATPKLRLAIRQEAGAFWKDRVGRRSLAARSRRRARIVVGRALAAEGFDTTNSPAPSPSTTPASTVPGTSGPSTTPSSTLDAIRRAGLRVGLITNGPKPLQRDKIDRFGIERYMDVIVIEGEFGVGKPERAVFAHALQSVGAEPAQAWHIGDNLYADVGGAVAAGLRAAWIHRDRLSLDENAGVKPDRIVSNLTEFREVLGLSA